MNGADDGTRTRDLLITNQLLYQLSYVGVALRSYRPPPRLGKINAAACLATPAAPAHTREPTFNPMETLLRLLQQDATTPREDIARLLNLSVEEVNSRIAAMEKDGVIRGYQAVVDRDKLDQNTVTAFIEVRITPERGGGFDRVAQRIAKFDQVVSCYLISGGYDLLVVVQGGSLREVASFVSEKLSTIESVISTATHFRLKAYKENGNLFLSEVNQDRLAVSP